MARDLGDVVSNLRERGELGRPEILLRIHRGYLMHYVNTCSKTVKCQGCRAKSSLSAGNTRPEQKHLAIISRNE